MPKAPIPQYVWLKPNRAGEPRAYYRRDGRSIAIGRLPTDRDFHAAYRQAAKRWEDGPVDEDAPREGVGAIATLFASYKETAKYRQLSPMTKRHYEARYENLLPILSPMDMRSLDIGEIEEVRDMLAEPAEAGGPDRPSRANEGMVLLSILLNRAAVIGWRTNVPKMPKPLRLSGDGWRTVTLDEYHALMDAPTTPDPVKQAISLLMWTGLRVSDAVSIERSAIVDGRIRFAPQKTKNRRRASRGTLSIPIHDELAPWLVGDSQTLLTNSLGRPWSPRGLAEAIARACEAAKLPHLTPHGFRQGLVALLAEQGETDTTIEAWVPHASGTLTRHYRRHAQTEKLADAAMARLPTRSKKGN